MKILITDDSKMARRMVKRTLTEFLSEEDEVFEGTNGFEAVDLYKENNPDLVFLDLTMDQMDGYEALIKIKEIDENAKVIVISADIQKAAVDKVRQSGAFDFVKKPIDAAKMKQIFQKLQRV